VDTVPDVHNKFVKSYESYQKEVNELKDFGAQFQLRSVSLDYHFLEKKPPKDYFSIDGVLKQNWISKYFDLIPSVVVHFLPFNGDWSSTEWTRREIMYTEKYNSLKSVLSPREIKIITIMVRIGSGVIDKEIFDERLSTFKRHMQLDSKTFFFFNSAEFSADVTTFKRVLKYLKEFSTAFYILTIKRFKSLEKSIAEKHKGAIESMLQARLNFKIAYLNEFQCQTNYVLKHYRQAYSALCENLDDIEDEMFDQFKTVGEIIHFKICSVLFSTNFLDEAFHQFRIHVSMFAKPRHANPTIPWRHYTWVSNQYIVFSQLLDLYAISENQLPFADRSYYYQNAARFTRRRLESFDRVRETALKRKLSTNTETEFRGLKLLPSRFAGSTPLFLDPKFDQLYSSDESAKLFSEYSAEQELLVDHRSLILTYLNNAIDRTTINHERRTCVLLMDVADIFISQSNYHSAVANLWKSLDLLFDEKWIEPSVKILYSIRNCSIQLGNVQDFLRASLMLYSLYISRQNQNSNSYVKDLQEIHLNVVSVLSSSLASFSEINRKLISNPHLQSMFETHQPTVLRQDFGSQASKSQDSVLPDFYSIDVRKGIIEMFSIEIVFSKNTISFGEKLEITLTISSRFIDSLVFDKMDIFFIDRSPEFTFVHGQEDLTFHPNVRKTFKLEVEITEERFTKFLSNDSIFCMEAIDLVWSKSVETENKSFKMHISALPKEIAPHLSKINNYQCDATSQQKENNILSLKDHFGFCLEKGIHNSYCQITKPKGIVQLLNHSCDKESVGDCHYVILQDLIHRVDLYFSTSVSEIRDVAVFLSSDRVGLFNTVGTIEEDYLFWGPSIADLSKFEQNRTENQKKLSSYDIFSNIEFSPFILNSSFQPAFPIKLNGNVHKNSVFVVPLFLRSKIASVFNVKLSVEFIAKDIMKSPLIEEFQVKITVKSPLNVNYFVSNDTVSPVQSLLNSDIYHTPAAHDLFARSLNNLSMKTKCSVDLNDSLRVRSTRLKISSNFQTSQLFSSSSSTEAKFSEHEDYLKLDEEYYSSMRFSYTAATNSSAQQAIRIGVWEISWHLSATHPLQFELDQRFIDSTGKTFQYCGVFDKSSMFSWMLSPISKNSDENERSESEYFYPQVKGPSEAVSSFHLPTFRVSLRNPILHFHVFYLSDCIGK
jgi:hypothetical protein